MRAASSAFSQGRTVRRIAIGWAESIRCNWRRASRSMAPTSSRVAPTIEAISPALISPKQCKAKTSARSGGSSAMADRIRSRAASARNDAHRRGGPADNVWRACRPRARGVGVYPSRVRARTFVIQRRTADGFMAPYFCAHAICSGMRPGRARRLARGYAAPCGTQGGMRRRTVRPVVLRMSQTAPSDQDVDVDHAVLLAPRSVGDLRTGGLNGGGRSGRP